MRIKIWIEDDLFGEAHSDRSIQLDEAITEKRKQAAFDLVKEQGYGLLDSIYGWGMLKTAKMPKIEAERI